MADNQKEETEYNLEADSELRFEIEQKDAKVSVTLISGFAELFGTELVKMKEYTFRVGTKVAIFTYHGCHLRVSGKMDVCYVSKETPMVQYINCHSALEQMRIESEKRDERGPIAMIVGPKDAGKTTLCRQLLNYAVRSSRRPLYADIDAGQGVLSIPGNIATLLIERPADIEEGFTKTEPLVYHFGHKSPSDNNVLYKTIITNMAKMTLQSMTVNKRTKHSGIIINTCGWVQGDGYNFLMHAAKAYEVNTIFVLDQERLYRELLRDIPSSVNIVLLPKSGGVVTRSKRMRNDSCDLRIKEYFYGHRTPLYPFSFEIKFIDLRLYKIGGAPALPDSCMPIGMKAKHNKTTVFPVKPSPTLLHHLLSVSFADSPEDDDVIGTNIAGFLCVTQVDMQRQSITVLSPQPRLMTPKPLLLLSELQFMDSDA